MLQACEAWKKEAEELKRKARTADEEKLQALMQREEVVNTQSFFQHSISGYIQLYNH